MFFDGHNHTDRGSNIRLIDCINKPIDLIDQALKLGLSGIAITDHEALCSHVIVNKYAKELKEKYPDFTIALGNEIYLTNTRTPQQKYYHFILIAKDQTGYLALKMLSSQAWINSYTYGGLERVPTLKSEVENVMKWAKGHLIATTACIGGELSQLLLESYRRTSADLNDDDVHTKAHKFVNWCIDTFGKDDFYIECAPGCSKDQIIVNRLLYYEIAKPYGLKMIPASDSHYLSKELRFAHKAYLNSKDGEREVDAFYEYSHSMSEAEAKENLRQSFDDEEILNWLFENTEIERKSITWFDLYQTQRIPTVEVNPPEAFAWWGCNNDFADDFGKNGCYKTLGSLFTSDEPQERQWINDVWDSLNETIGYWGDHEDYVQRLEIEADVIKYIGDRLNTCLFAYFNTFKHYIDFFWECGSIVGPGRGSATGFLSNYLLGITQLDPIKWNLPWFRFLNKERVELPSLMLILGSIKNVNLARGCAQIAC